ncbi:hypothetical protein JCGZ_08623 [Jatropha curcas]|uniref:Uncharacterized protein n=1 Tax=Jatropha curcas TaxID=180498 RepID=A0A067KYP6_JATCU|nr:hypothetical protein JCGZ_08623 [Jatropha curcas]
MADDIGDETGFSQAQIRAIAQIVAAALAQDRAQNQATPASSNQPAVKERQIPEPVLATGLLWEIVFLLRMM